MAVLSRPVSAAAGAMAATTALLSASAFVQSSTGSTALRGAPAHGTGARQASGASLLSSSAMAAPVVLASAAMLMRRGRAAARSAVVRAAFENEIGSTLPLKYFDPLGLAKDGDEKAFKRRRASEIKNGRVAMLAVMGYIAPEYSRFPGFVSPSENLKFTDLPNGLQALYKMPAEGWAQIFVFIAFLELFPMWQDKERLPGDFAGFGKFGVPGFGSKANPEANKRSLEAELNNGRLAMLAIVGMVGQNALFGTTGPAMWLPGASAFESELGAQAPVGFWDPLGFSSDGNVDNFRRRRAVELKHGRISMLATIGYIVPEYFKWPGEIAPSQGLKFADIPAGLAAITKVPGQGWLQIALFLGHFEGFFYRQEANRPPGDFANVGFLGIWKNFIFNVDPPVISDPAERAKKLSAELANGRLAMVAITALVFQNGTVGGTGPEMWLPKAQA